MVELEESRTEMEVECDSREEYNSKNLGRGYFKMIENPTKEQMEHENPDCF